MDPDPVQINHDDLDFEIDEQRISMIARTVCTGLGVGNFEVGISFVNEDEIRILNHDFRQKDQATDVLSFPQQEWDGPLSFSASRSMPEQTNSDGPPETLGDIVISLSYALKNAEGIGQSLDRETCFLLVHGLLHLCGHDHMEPQEEQTMLGQQKIIMDLLDKNQGHDFWLGCARAASKPQ